MLIPPTTLRRPARRFSASGLPILALAAVSFLSTACDIVTADMKSSATAEWKKTYTLDPGGRVEISNVNGRIQVEQSAGNQVDVLAEKKAKGASDDAAKQALERIEIKEEVSASAIRDRDQDAARVRDLPRLERGLLHDSGAGRRRRALHHCQWRRRISPGSTNRVRAETTNGGIVARDVSGAIEATTTNGGLDVDVVKVSAEGVTLGCTNGGIKLRLPADAAATISASVTNGAASKPTG